MKTEPAEIDKSLLEDTILKDAYDKIEMFDSKHIRTETSPGEISVPVSGFSSNIKPIIVIKDIPESIIEKPTEEL